jgi:flagellar basal body-associated protein FliL
MLKQLLEQGLLEGPKQAIEDAKTRIIFALLGLIVGIVALTFIFYTAFLWLSVPYGPLHAAGLIAALLVVLTGVCVAVVCWPGDKKVRTPPAPPPPEAEAVLAIEQLSRSMGELGRGKNGGMAMLGILAGVTALGFGLGRKN